LREHQVTKHHVIVSNRVFLRLAKSREKEMRVSVVLLLIGLVGGGAIGVARTSKWPAAC
jgi:hypothetical protein